MRIDAYERREQNLPERRLLGAGKATILLIEPASTATTSATRTARIEAPRQE
jgi:hypothetical protein